ncbi:MAG: hypothetical protein QG608_1900 [Actinomycetota bacterium]|nr:hypothetical protein [Actinomycetota bacterium]
MESFHPVTNSLESESDRRWGTLRPSAVGGVVDFGAPLSSGWVMTESEVIEELQMIRLRRS